jgi:eukaryotic-like serine/threonine-protein kinase
MRPVPPPYRLVRLLGEGSVFEVAGVADETGRPLVLKRPRAVLAEGVLGTAALARERDILAAAGGRHVPRLIEASVDDAGPYLVETLAPGMPIRQLGEAAPLSAEAWTAVALASFRALAALHALAGSEGPLDIVHGDLSPDNAFVEGLAGVSFVDLSAGSWKFGRSSVFPSARGTLPYVAPEVARAERAPDQATDVYALSAVLLWLAVGPIVESATEAGRLDEVGSRGVRAAWIERRTDVGAGARAAIKEALALDRGRRCAAAGRLAERLAAPAGPIPKAPV